MSSDFSPQFQSDYNQLGTDSEAYEASLQKEQQDKQEYNAGYAQIQSMIAAGADPEEILMALIYLIMGPGMDEFDDQMAVDGDALNIDGDLTACNNDIEEDINSGSASLDTVASEEDAMMAVLNPNGDPNAPSWAVDTQSAIGSTASDTLYGSYKDMRDTMYISTDPTYNPADPTASTVYFSDDENDPTKLHSFSEMTTDMSEQGDPQHATEAAQELTNDLNENTSTTGTVQSAALIEVQYLTQQIQLTQTFAQDLMQELIDTEKVAIQNDTRQ